MPQTAVPLRPGRCLRRVYCIRAAQKAFIYDIQIDQPYQGKGYGGDTLACLENELRPYALRQIGLNIFGDNERAFRLYQKAGYYIVATHMQKDVTS
jgi:ribosomal protein S18 acetylase RimI-like enzyme